MRGPPQPPWAARVEGAGASRIPAVIPDELVSRLDVSAGEQHRAPACRAHHGPVGGEPIIVKAGGLKGVAGTDGGFGRLAGRHMQRQLGALPS